MYFYPSRKENMDVLKPSPTLLIELGSLIVHYEEFLSPDGRHIDKEVIDELRGRPEVDEWFREMDRLAFLPVKRVSAGPIQTPPNKKGNNILGA